MSDNWYDTAQVCTSGHVITESSVSSPNLTQKFCDKCGAPTITNCQNCDTPIRGYYHVPSVSHINFAPTPPGFCHECGKPYPWTEAKLKAAKELSDELDSLSAEERGILKKSIDDIVRDTPQTTVAATRFKKIAAKVGGIAAKQLRELVVDIASETAKKIILERK